MITVAEAKFFNEASLALWESWRTIYLPGDTVKVGLTSSYKDGVLRINFSRLVPGFSDATYSAAYTAMLNQILTTGATEYGDDVDALTAEINAEIPLTAARILDFVSGAFIDKPNMQIVEVEAGAADQFLYATFIEPLLITDLTPILAAISPMPGLVSTVTYSVTIS